jgi:hypothetical protein
MTDRSTRDIVVGVLLLLCRWMAIIGWPVVVTLNINLAVAGVDPIPLHFHGLILSIVGTVTVVAAMDWSMRRMTAALAAQREKIEGRLDTIERWLDAITNTQVEHTVRLDNTADLPRAHWVPAVYRGSASVGATQAPRRRRSRKVRGFTPEMDAELRGLIAGSGADRPDDDEHR